MSKEARYWRNSSARDFIYRNGLGDAYDAWRTSRGMSGDPVQEKIFANMFNRQTANGINANRIADDSVDDDELAQAKIDEKKRRTKKNLGLLTALAGAAIPNPLSIPMVVGGLGYGIHQGGGASGDRRAIERMELARALKIAKAKRMANTAQG